MKQLLYLYIIICFLACTPKNKLIDNIKIEEQYHNGFKTFYKSGLEDRLKQCGSDISVQDLIENSQADELLFDNKLRKLSSKNIQRISGLGRVIFKICVDRKGNAQFTKIVKREGEFKNDDLYDVAKSLLNNIYQLDPLERCIACTKYNYNAGLTSNKFMK